MWIIYSADHGLYPKNEGSVSGLEHQTLCLLHCSTTQETIHNHCFENLTSNLRYVYQDESRGSGIMKRESWMLELPPDREADFGLGPRQFRARAKPEPGDRSVWTDTPADRLQKKLSPVCLSLSVFITVN